MYSYLMLDQVARQRIADQHEAARRTGQRRALRAAARAARRREAARDVELPPVPDYVDGTFRGTEETGAAERAGTAR